MSELNVLNEFIRSLWIYRSIFTLDATRLPMWPPPLPCINPWGPFHVPLSVPPHPQSTYPHTPTPPQHFSCFFYTLLSSLPPLSHSSWPCSIMLGISSNPNLFWIINEIIIMVYWTIIRRPSTADLTLDGRGLKPVTLVADGSYIML